MATNYTTKTAALRATIADIRKVTAKSVEAEKLHASALTVDQDGSAVNVLDAIEAASAEATAAAGIHVGTESSMVKGGADGNLNVDADSDGNLDAGVPQKVKGMNFCGNVAVVNNEDGTVDFWFMNPDNPGTPDSNTSESLATAGSMYVYAGEGDINGLTGNSTHTTTRLKTATGADTYTLKGADGEVMSAENKVSTIKVVAVDGAGTEIDSVETPAICEANTTEKTRNGSISVTSPTAGIKIELTDVIDNKVDTANNINDAQGGYTPGYVRFKGKVKTYTNKLTPNGGTSKIKIYFAGKEIESGTLVYTYASNALTADDAPTATLTYTPGTTQTQISGISYDSSATVTLSVSGIKGTQRGGAHSKKQSERAVVSTAITGNAGISFAKNTVIATSLESGTATDDTAVLSGTLTDACSVTGEPVKASISTAGKIAVYEQGGTASSVATAVPTTFTSDSWIYTQTATAQDTDYTAADAIEINFTSDGSRVLADYATLKEAGTTATYDKSKHLVTETDYQTQLLVQGGKLRHPKTDATGTYTTTATGTRSYVVPVTFSEKVVKLKITAGGLGSSFNNSTMRIYIVNDNAGTIKAQCLNWYNGDNTNCSTKHGATAIATDQAPSSDAWNCEANPSIFALEPGSSKYYLVVEMDETCTTKLSSLKVSAQG